MHSLQHKGLTALTRQIQSDTTSHSLQYELRTREGRLFSAVVEKGRDLTNAYRLVWAAVRNADYAHMERNAICNIRD